VLPLYPMSALDPFETVVTVGSRGFNFGELGSATWRPWPQLLSTIPSYSALRRRVCFSSLKVTSGN
jgi:hypothetical protein